MAWINSIFLVMNLLILLRIFFALCKTGAVLPLSALEWIRRVISRQLKETKPVDFRGYEIAAA